MTIPANTLVDTAIIHVITTALDKLVGACLDDKGAPKAPTKKELMEARKMLPAYCKHTLTKR